MNPAVHRYVRGWVTAGAVAGVALVVLAVRTPRLEVPWWQIAIGFVAMVAAEHLFTTVRYRDTEESLSFSEVVVVPLYVFFDPVTASIVVVASLVASEVALRKPAIKLAFNVGWMLVAATVVAWIVHLAGAAPGTPLTLRDLGAVTVAAVLYGLLNVWAVSGVVARTEGEDPRRVLRASMGLHRLMALGNISVGLAFALLLEAGPLLAPVALLPLVALRTAYVAASRDRQGRIAVTEERDRLDRIVDGASDGIVLIDADGVVRVWNPAMAMITGVPGPDAIGGRVTELIDAELLDAGPGEDGTSRIDRALSAVLDGEEEHVELDVHHGDGTIRHVAVAGNHVFDLRQRPAGSVLIVRDVTREIEIDRLKHDFLAKVSHELRTPLTAILGFTQVLTRRWSSLADERRRDYVAVLDRQANRLWRLISGVLIASEIERGELRPQPAEIDGRVIVEETVKGMETEEDIRITAHVRADVTLFADHDHVREMLLRLLTNAVTSGAGSVTVQAERREDVVEIEVRDDGPGVPDAFVPRLFDRFAQPSAGDVREEEGLGLGLYLVRELAVANGGEVSYEPNEPRGACFRLVLPVGPEEAPPWNPGAVGGPGQ